MSERTAHAHQMTNSHILVQEFDYHEPISLKEATSLLSEYGDRARVLAGGTYLLVQMKMEHLLAEQVVNISLKAAESLIQKTLEERDHRQFIEQAISEIDTKVQ